MGALTNQAYVNIVSKYKLEAKSSAKFSVQSSVGAENPSYLSKAQSLNSPFNSKTLYMISRNFLITK